MCNLICDCNVKRCLRKLRKSKICCCIKEKAAQKILNVVNKQKFPVCHHVFQTRKGLGRPPTWSLKNPCRNWKNVGCRRVTQRYSYKQGEKKLEYHEDKEFVHKKTIHSVVSTEIWNSLLGQWDWLYCMYFCFEKCSLFPVLKSYVLWCHPLAIGEIKFLA